MKRERKSRTEGSIDIAFCGILFPDEGQEELIRKTMGCKRFVYNLFLDERIKAY
ncbi:MAG: helix-turn-helix domain-containing protein, partial [Lachnospiraceae bacterium]|nr:helix-turn-helix domain-containing protein [Lachnospiraceae bacterium]